MEEFKNEINKLQHLKNNVFKGKYQNIELTPHNGLNYVKEDCTEEKLDILRDYLLHVLQFGTPEERIKILAGVNSKFKLTNRKLHFL